MSPDLHVVARLRAAGCVFAEDEARLLADAAHTTAELDAMVARRAAGLPLEQVIGWAEFCGLRVLVDPGVFVPRRRSEFLVETAVALAPDDPVVVDLCCGTGALGLATAARLRGAGRSAAELHAADLDPAAVRCARRNVEPAGGQVYEGDLFGPLPDGLRGRISVLICNAPYVPSHEVAFLPAEARDHEPRTALDGGRDGLEVLRAVTAQAPRWLAADGHLLVETSERQSAAMAAAMSAAGLAARVRGREEAGATVVTACFSLSRTNAAYSPEHHDSSGQHHAAAGQAAGQAPAVRARGYGHRGDRGGRRAACHRPGDRVPGGASPRRGWHHRGGGRGAV